MYHNSKTDNKFNLAEQLERLTKIIDQMSLVEILKKLDETLMPIELKMKMFERMEYLLLDFNAVGIIENYFLSKTELNESYLDKPYWPMTVKKIVAKKIYGDNLEKVVQDSSTSFDVKKKIIDYCFFEFELLNVLASDLEPKVLNYIIDSKFTASSSIVFLLSNSKVSNSIKERVINEKIDSNNIFDILQTTLISASMQQKVYDMKSETIERYVEELKGATLLEKLNSSFFPDEIKTRVLALKKKEIIRTLKITNINKFYMLLLFSHSEEFSKLLIESCPIKAKMCISLMTKVDVLKFLNGEHVPNEFKEAIISNKKKIINSAIEDLDFSTIARIYLTDDSNLPREIQKLIVDKKKAVIEQGIDAMSNSDVIDNLFFRDYAQDLKEVLITRRVNEGNMFQIFDSYNYNRSVVDLVLTLKKDLISKYLQGLDSKKLFELKQIKSNLLKKKIVDGYSFIFFSRIENVDDETLYLYFNNPDVSFAVRAIILKKFNFKEEDICNCLELLRHNYAKTVLINYDKVKAFFGKLDISFSSFIQYGCGSSTYSSWLDELVEILDSGKDEKLIAAYKYLNSNLYEEEDMSNPIVAKISNFLKVLDNYSNNSELLDLLSSNNTQLSSVDKANLEFLFNWGNGQVEISSLEQINDLRKAIYQQYMELLNDEDATVNSLRVAFKEFVFCDADLVIKDIGGSTNLKILKKKNEAFPSICSKIDELLSYAELVEKVSNTSDINSLKALFREILTDETDKLKNIQYFSYHIEQKVSSLFEQEFRVNLTPISVARANGCAIDKELSLKYGGEVFDFSDKNYVLCAHVLSYDANIDDLVNGVSNSDSNFISVSPISYLGQNYYWDKRDVILAYDAVPKGNYICSSISNMGSNGAINSNSFEVKDIYRVQRGILETSAVIGENPEALLYREGLKPCGLILVDGKIPSDDEMKYHKKYNLPFIITQAVNMAIEQPKVIFDNKEENEPMENNFKLSEEFTDLKSKIVFSKETLIYTGREIAIIADPHSMFEPTIAVLESIKQKDIDEIYSLGDNVGLGANPDEVFDMLEYYGVKSVAGNSEYYNTLGVKPFVYLDKNRWENQLWTFERLGESRVEKMRLFPPSIDLLVGDKKIALCHFVNDIRWDYINNSTWSYQSNFTKGVSGLQFLYTNSDEAKADIKRGIETSYDEESARGYLSALDSPIFGGKGIDSYDAIFQGHVHFHMVDRVNDTDIYTLRATGMGGDKSSQSSACYYVLKEKKTGGFDVEKVLVDFNKNSLISNTKSSSIPHKEKVLNFLKG